MMLRYVDCSRIQIVYGASAQRETAGPRCKSKSMKSLCKYHVFMIMSFPPRRPHFLRTDHSLSLHSSLSILPVSYGRFQERAREVEDLGAAAHASEVSDLTAALATARGRGVRHTRHARERHSQGGASHS